MKQLLLAFLVCSPLFAIKSVKIVPSGGAPIPTAYTLNDANSRVMSELPSIYHHLFVYNGTADMVACLIDNSSNAVAPTAGDAREVHVPTLSGVVLDNVSIAKNIYCRPEGGSAITAAAPLLIHVW